MVIKKFNQNLNNIERTVFLERNGLGREFEKMPEELLIEIEAFSHRNPLGTLAYRLKDKKEIYYCCPNCLKAHLIKQAQRIGRKNLRKILSRILNGEVGHDGYYIDGEEIKRV
ncbi:hypothetical protein HYV50_02235 [Candidatus Pacearchaeota archaeon]|nr:hypothetical protein [Candidatus Pacearchaeota archaeon]